MASFDNHKDLLANLAMLAGEVVEEEMSMTKVGFEMWELHVHGLASGMYDYITGEMVEASKVAIMEALTSTFEAYKKTYLSELYKASFK